MQPKSVSEVIESLNVSSEFDNLLYVYRDELIITQPDPLYRVNGEAGDRYYYRVRQNNEGENEFVFFPSITTFCKKVLPTGFALIQWMKKNGEESDTIRDQRADFGTLMHICFADFLTHGYDFFNTSELVARYVEKTQNPRKLIGPWTLELNKNIAAFKQFCTDYDVKPLAIEIMLASEEFGIAGTMDLPCSMFHPDELNEYQKEMRAYNKSLALYEEKCRVAAETGKKAPADFDKELPKEPRRINALVDFKSGSVHESAELQLSVSKYIFEENFPSVKIDCLFNWSPKEWRGETPTYNFTDQTDTKFDYKAICTLLDYYALIYPAEIESKKVFQFAGKIFNDAKPVRENVRLTNLGEKIERQFESKNSATY